MDEKEKMHNDVMFGVGMQSQSFVQKSLPATELDNNSNEFLQKISSFDFGIKYE
jgi:hypothetical protein